MAYEWSLRNKCINVVRHIELIAQYIPSSTRRGAGFGDLHGRAAHTEIGLTTIEGEAFVDQHLFQPVIAFFITTAATPTATTVSSVFATSLIFRRTAGALASPVLNSTMAERIFSFNMSDRISPVLVSAIRLVTGFRFSNSIPIRASAVVIS